MMKHALIGLALVAPLPALAADPAPAVGGLPASVELTVTQIQELSATLHAFDGYQGVDKSGASAQMQYNLGDLRWPIADDLKTLKAVLDENELARQALAKEKFPDGTPPAGTAEFSEFVKTDAYRKFIDVYQKRLDAKHSVTLEHLSKRALNVGDPPGKNPIPPSVLGTLDQYGLVDP